MFQDVKIKKGNLLENKILKSLRDLSEKIKDLNAMDFGDLILNTVTLFEKSKDIAEIYRKILNTYWLMNIKTQTSFKTNG